MKAVLPEIAAKTVWDQRRSLLGWSIGLVALLVLEGALWPSVRDMPDLDQLLSGYPEGMKEVFSLDAMDTGVGFLNAELYTLLLPALFIGFGVARGARLVAGEEEAGTLEILLVTPVSTTGLYLAKALGLLVSMLALGCVVFGATLAVSAAFSMEVSLGQALVGSMALLLLGLEYGWLALAVGAMTGRRGVALGITAVAAVGGYVLYVGGLIVNALETWLPWSPFHQALADGPLDGTLPPRFGWLALGAAAALVSALPVFARRDIRVGR